MPGFRQLLAAAALAALATGGLGGPARADIVIGALLSLTGPSASLGIPARNTIELLPTRIGGEAVRWVVLDDASDPATAVRGARKLVDQEHVDVIIGPSNTPCSVAILDVAAETGTPFLSLSGSNAVIEPPEASRRWAFKMFPAERLATGQMAEHMKRSGVVGLSQIGFATGLGDGYFAAMRADAAARSNPILAEARYNPDDTAVTGQVLRLMQPRPGAVFVAASGTPATTPIIELRNRGYSGQIYTVMGIAGPDPLRVGGKSLDGVLLSGVPVLTAEQLDDAAPSKAPAMAFILAYEGRYGPKSRNLFAATFWDAFLLVDAGARTALSAGGPGNAAFRLGLRDAMERVHAMAGAQGVFSLSPQDHSGAEPSSQVLIEIRDGGYRLVK
jgi:branched-chain amino acid transport system substrate-binding protein